MDTLLSIIIALSFGGAAILAIWLLVEAADAVALAHAACPILGIGLWTNPSPARECA
ncbi:TPA: hypothetical protein ACLA9V_000073 [Neisseria meningitidis]